MTTKAEALIARLVADEVIEPGQVATVARTYAGREQRAQGAWSWCLVDESGRELFVGSHYSVTELLRHPHWVYSPGMGGNSVYPE